MTSSINKKKKKIVKVFVCKNMYSINYKNNTNLEIPVTKRLIKKVIK